MIRAFSSFLLLTFLLTFPPAFAQETLASRLDAAKIELDQIEATLSRDNLDDATLENLRERTEPVRGSVTGILNEITPRLQAVDGRLEQLGAAPEGDAQESPEVTKDRETQARTRQELDESLRRGRLLLVQADQITEQVTARRRALFTSQLFERSRSILDPALWLDFARSTPNDATSLRFLLNDWMRLFANRMGAAMIFVLSMSLLAALLIAGPGSMHLQKFGQRFAVQQVPPSRLRRSGNAIWMLLITTAAPTVTALILYYGCVISGVLPPRLEPLARAIVGAVFFVAFVRGLSHGILAPGRASWRLPALADATVDRVKRQPESIASVFVLGRILAQFNETLGTSLATVMITNGLVAVANAITFAMALRALRAARMAQSDVKTPDALETGVLLHLFTLVAWVAIAMVLLAAVTGYIAFALFLANQIIWTALLGAVLYLLLAFVDDLFTVGCMADNGFARFARETVGLRQESLEQIGILLSGVLRLVIIVIFAMMALAPWGISGGDAFGWAQGAASGFTIAGFTLSPTALLGALLILALGVVVTRAIQRWLEVRFLPHTRMDMGLQNSIRTGFGYFGVILAGAIALSYLGLGLEKLAIVAGALSVGIGFGLQSIVNNFVSGLILLAERPIKVGDWVVIGAEEGNVRRISVRSTEIELFNRSTLIVPNSELITQKVVNRTLSNTAGRIQVDLNIGYDTPPNDVRALLLSCAEDHAVVLAEPPPKVTFNSLGADVMSFSLYCFVPSPRQAGDTRSELYFNILQKLREAGIKFPPAKPDPVEALASALQGLTQKGGELKEE